MGIVNRLQSQVEVLNCIYVAEIIKLAKLQDAPVITQFNSQDICSEFYHAESRTSDEYFIISAFKRQREQHRESGSGPGVNTGLTGVVWKRQEFWEKDTLLSLQGMITPDY